MCLQMSADVKFTCEVKCENDWQFHCEITFPAGETPVRVATEHLHSSLNANCIYELSGAGSSRSSGTSRRATATMAALFLAGFWRPFDEED